MFVSSLRKSLAEHLQAGLNARVYAFQPAQHTGDVVIVKVGDVSWHPVWNVVSVEVEMVIPVVAATTDERLTELSERVYSRVQSFNSVEGSWIGEPYETTLSAPRTVPLDTGDAATVTCRFFAKVAR